MPEIPSGESKAPGIVIFTAILNFISAGAAALVFLVSLVGLFFGNMLGVAQWMTDQITQVSQSANISYGVTFIFIMLLLAGALSLAYFLFVGIGLLKGNKIAWFFQIASSVLGLFGFPFGTILNVVILILFFQPGVRNYFKV